MGAGGWRPVEARPRTFHAPAVLHLVLWGLAVVPAIWMTYAAIVWIGGFAWLLLPIGWIRWGWDGLPPAVLIDFVLVYPLVWSRSQALRRVAWRLVAILEVVAVIALAGWELWMLALLPMAVWMGLGAWQLSNREM